MSLCVYERATRAHESQCTNQREYHALKFKELYYDISMKQLYGQQSTIKDRDTISTEDSER